MAKNNHYITKKDQAQAPVEKQLKRRYIAFMAAALLVLAVCLTLIIWPKGTGDLYADIIIKNYGTVTVKLEPEVAPITVDNFVKLAKSGFYDGLTFHRIKEGFMMQGGDPKADGTGNASSTIKGEFSANGHPNTLPHTAGAISMARSNDFNSASCQFFIMHKDTAQLNGYYAVFGYVVKGMEIVDKICTEAEPINSNYLIAKDKQPIIETIKIYNK